MISLCKENVDHLNSFVIVKIGLSELLESLQKCLRYGARKSDTWVSRPVL